MDLYQTILPSGRGVRYRLLTPTQHDDTLLKAAQLCGKDATNAAVGLCRMREAIKCMLHSVTAEKLKGLEELAAAKWLPLDAAKLEGVREAGLSYDALFNARDDAALSHIFRSNHELSQIEADAIVGKAQPVSVD